jgi:hypothetical protein
MSQIGRAKISKVSYGVKPGSSRRRRSSDAVRLTMFAEEVERRMIRRMMEEAKE